MKKTVGIAFLITIAMLLIPLSVINNGSSISASTSAENIPAKLPSAKEAASEVFRVCDAATGKVTEMDAEEYIFGVVAAEMPALYEEEALKAQAVAAYTYACCRRAENSHKSYDITTDHTTDQSFITEKAAREKWGDNADTYVNKIKKAVEDTSGYMITCNGKPITAVYHAISSGKTEDCKNVWGRELSYLKPVVSEGDRLSPDYIEETTFTIEQIKEKLAEEVELSSDAASFFGECSRTESGTVTKIKVCSESLTGARLRSLLDLRSTNFEVKYTENSFVFTTYGYGHGVGMSQYGANYMAKQGSDFKEILTHYYTGCKVEKIS